MRVRSSLHLIFMRKKPKHLLRYSVDDAFPVNRNLKPPSAMTKWIFVNGTSRENTAKFCQTH